MGGAGDGHPNEDRGSGHRSSGVVGPQPGADDSVACDRRRGCSCDRAANRVGCRRVDPSQRSRLRTECPLRDRSPYGRPERLLARAGGGDHARHPDLPRQVERLERHRLQLSRRSLRHDLRGPLRRHRPKRDRRPRARIQHGIRRRGGDRHLRNDGNSGCGVALTREAARVAPRSRACRSPGGVPDRVGWERALPPRRTCHAAGRIGTPRHRADELSGELSLRPARHDRRQDPLRRPAQDLRSHGHGCPRGLRPVQGSDLIGPSLARRRRGPARRRTGLSIRPGADSRVDVGCVTRHGHGHSLENRGRGCDAGSRKPRQARGRWASHYYEPRSEPDDDQPERRRPC